jgi:hypothetical protein
VLWHVAHHGPLRKGRPGPPHATAISRLDGVKYLNGPFFLAPKDIVPLLVLLVCLTGLEPGCAKRLDAVCLSNPARGFVSIRYVKRRARGRENKTLRVSDGGSLRHPGGLIRALVKLTAQARRIAEVPGLWVEHGYAGTRTAFAPGIRHGFYYHHDEWLARHGLDRLQDTSHIDVVVCAVIGTRAQPAIPADACAA